MNPALKYYKETTLFNISFSILCGLFTGLMFSFIIFGTIGVWVGLKVYDYFYSNQYYIYYNLGYSKTHLIIITLVLNIFISVVLLISYFFLNV